MKRLTAHDARVFINVAKGDVPEFHRLILAKCLTALELEAASKPGHIIRHDFDDDMREWSMLFNQNVRYGHRAECEETLAVGQDENEDGGII